MSTVMNPYVNLRGTAREAGAFYQAVFGGELVVTTFREGGVDRWPDQLDLVMHSRLITDTGMVLMVSDVPETMDLTVGDDIAISLGGDDAAALTAWWEGLSDGATITMPLAQAPWGDSFGELRDRFGVRWLVNIAASADDEG